MVPKCSKNSMMWNVKLADECVGISQQVKKLNIHPMKTVDTCSINENDIVFFF